MMPGQKINQRQVEVYMKYRKQGKSQEAAAVKAGFSERSAGNLKKQGMKVAHCERQWKTRKDPFENVWESVLVPMLEEAPNLQAKTLLEYLQEKYEDRFPDQLLRTLQRRVRHWRAVNGPDKEVIFRQNHPPGWQGLSDFTEGSSLKITVSGQSFEHILYHYRLAFSGWEHAEVVLGGESFTALAEGLQNALWHCGGSPETHRTDSLSAAFKNLSTNQQSDLTKDYEEICSHYGIEPTRNNRGVSHENGTIESSHRHLKSQINQALLVRGNREFESVEEYRDFIRGIIKRHNRRVHARYLEELGYLRDLPQVKTIDYTEVRVPVTNSSTIRVNSIIYSVPSRLIGETVKVHLYDDRLECFLGASNVVTLERKRKAKKYVHQIDYRHLIGTLQKKPTAFKNYVFREHLFPTLAFRQTWEIMERELDNRKACSEYVAILKEASIAENEGVVSHFLKRKLTEGTIATAAEVRRLFRSEAADLPKINTSCDDLASYSHLIGGGGS